MGEFDRSAEDVGNVQLLEHVNVTVPDQGLAALFYVTGLGFTRDPYIDFGTFNMWVNLGDQQFHLPQAEAQVLRGHIGVVVPDLEDLAKRLRFVQKPLANTQFGWQEQEDHVAVTCPWGNQIRAFAPGKFPKMDLGMPYVELLVAPGTIEGIGRFYRQVMGCACAVGEGAAGQVLVDGQLGEDAPALHHLGDAALHDLRGEVVGDLLAVPRDRPLGGLARAVRPEQRDDLTVGYLDRQAAQHEDDLVVDHF